ncbi:MAG: phage head closure protein [Solobacterium sp.]|jgi:SPP1 family predicted phage head-tail adaptor|nr:phage head closure protein [Solobacterium sp.]MCH4226780.1 phage head closure protein [Solobacterium sp.]MCH4281891.1 phage head closure protein [Solobacterium sp.]
MDRSEKVKLISRSFINDENGIQQPTETVIEIYANVKSASRSEWFEGGRNGLNPQYVFNVYDDEYTNEDVIEYDGTRYSIYRTYLNPDGRIDLYAELKKGVDE